MPPKVRENETEKLIQQFKVETRRGLLTSLTQSVNVEPIYTNGEYTGLVRNTIGAIIIIDANSHNRSGGIGLMSIDSKGNQHSVIISTEGEIFRPAVTHNPGRNITLNYNANTTDFTPNEEIIPFPSCSGNPIIGNREAGWYVYTSITNLDGNFDLPIFYNDEFWAPIPPQNLTLIINSANNIST